MRNPFRRLGSLILDLLFPIECLECRREGRYLCCGCYQKIGVNSSEEQERLKTSLKIPDLDGIFIAGNYDDPILNNLIIKYKYNFLSPLGKILADFLIDFWKTLELPSENILVIPVPLSQKRLRWRGFNQAELIAREFGSHLGCELSLGLKRQKHSRPQASLNEAGRLKNILSAFSWTGQILDGRTIIIIDDVVTTGATLNEAARTLKAAGAKTIYGLVLAKG